MKWVNLYGCNEDNTGMSNFSKSTKEKNKQNENEESASTFKGKLLIEYYTLDEKAPLMKVKDVKKTDEYEKRIESMRDMEFQIFAEIGSGICLPDSKDYKIKMSLGEFSWTSDAPK